MPAAWLDERRDDPSPAVWGDEGPRSHAELLAAVDAAAEVLASASGAVVVGVSPSLAGVARFAAAVRSGRPVLLLGDPPDPARLAYAISALGASLSFTDAGVERFGAPTGALPAGAIVLLTSGTTGTPKAVVHTLDTLLRPVRTNAGLRGSRWLATYPLQLYAGLQVLLHVLANAGTLVAPPAGGDADALVTRMIDAGVTHVSATPSFWRTLGLRASAERLAAIPLAQITLGGEIVPQDVLDRVAERWPAARVAHVYATSELGRCFSVTDRRAGFPVEWLATGAPDGVGLRIVDDVLEVRPRNAMIGYAGGAPAVDPWVSTGDLVAVQGDRVGFLGRRSDVLNVGGNKVNPVAVEERLRRVPGVRDVRVYGKKSSIVGVMVAAEIVAEPGVAPDALRARLQELAGGFAAAERPRFFTFVEEIQRTAAGKTRRTEEA